MSAATSRKIGKTTPDVSTANNSALWPEWLDVALNNENWATPKNGTDGLFLDTQLVQLPSSLEPSEWIRAKDLKNLTEPLTVFIPSSEYPDLIANNKHILHSEFVRWFISALMNLQYCGRHGLEISGENNSFIWNGQSQSWRGWMNVYSMNKAGKGAQHRPTVNLNGKYIVRVYLLGSWRRIVVDDMIPVDFEGLPLLPRTANNSELWPMILSKALLKLCSLTWSRHCELIDFHPVTCLTGWVCLQLDIDYLSPQDKWDFLRKYADHFEWEAKTTVQDDLGAPRSKINAEGKKSKETVQTKKSKDTVRTKSKGTDTSKKSGDTGRSKKSRDSAQKPKIPRKPQPVTLFLGLDDAKHSPSDSVPGLPPSLSHFVYVFQSRDIPLDPKDVKPPLARWKLHRWLKWAIDEGLIDPIEYFVPLRSLKIVSPLKGYEKSIINRYSNPNIEEDLQTEDASNKTATEKTDRKSKARDTSKEPQKGALKEDLSVDMSFWVDFNKMEPFVKNIQFFYKLDYFQYTARISDRLDSKLADQRSETKKGSKKDSKKSSPSRGTFRDPVFSDTFCWPKKMSKSRNEPLYIFTDSLEEKFFLINFSTFQVSLSSGNGSKTDNTTSVPIVKDDHLIVEKHSWLYRPKKSYSLVLLSTAGSKSTVMELPAGRHLLRVYCRSESCCFTTISSDTIFYLGDRRRMYQLMCAESEMIDQMVKHMSNCASRAYQSFGTESYAEALRAYYDSYMPPTQVTNIKSKMFYNQIHEYVIEEMVNLIQKIMPESQVPDIVLSLKVFFLNPKIGMKRLDTMGMILKALRGFNSSSNSTAKHRRTDESLNVYTWDEINAAIVIQSFFKMLLIRRYKKIHNPSHKQHQQVLSNLLKVAELFNYNKRDSLANQLLRNTLRHHDTLYNMYPCSRDLQYTIQVQEVTGTLTNIRPNQWLPITRLVVNPGATETVITGMDLFVDLPKYSLRVFNNESGQEMLRVVNNVVATRYQHIKSGYTVFGYGWSEDQVFKELAWTMKIITMKGQPLYHLLDDEAPISATTVLPVLTIEELSNKYIPNKKKYVSKWVVRVVKLSVVSFRLSTSYDQVKIKFRVIDEEGKVVSQVKGTSVVILPVVYLRLVRETSETEIGRGDDVTGSSLDSSVNEGNSGEILNGDGDSKGTDVTNDGHESKKSEKSVDHRIYYAEAFVLDDSWPLTKSEWATVSDIKVKPTGSIVKTRSSASTVGRLSKSELLKSKKGSKQSVDSHQAREPPYWVLQVVTDSGSGVEVSEDRTKAKEIAQMKEAWAKENPDSLQRGKELRKAFINEHKFEPDSSTVSVRRKSLTQTRRPFSKRDSARSSLDCMETSMLSLETRSLKPCELFRRLPPLDLLTYMVTEEEEDIPWVKTELDEEVLRISRTMNIIYAKEDYQYFLEEMQAYLNKQKEKYQMLFDQHADTFWEMRDMLEDTYELRKTYVNSLKPVSAPRSGKKSVKSKKV